MTVRETLTRQNSNARRAQSHIAFDSPTEWTAADLRLIFSLNSLDSSVSLPCCKDITFYRRSGKMANFDFLVTYSSPSMKGEGKIWTSYLDVVQNNSSRAVLANSNFRIEEMVNKYDEDERESVFESHSENGEYVPRKRKGLPKILTKRRTRK